MAFFVIFENKNIYMESVSLVFYLMAFVGVLFLFASISSWPWFFKQRRPQIFIEKFGMKGAP